MENLYIELDNHLKQIEELYKNSRLGISVLSGDRLFNYYNDKDTEKLILLESYKISLSPELIYTIVLRIKNSKVKTFYIKKLNGNEYIVGNTISSRMKDKELFNYFIDRLEDIISESLVDFYIEV